MEDMMKGIMGKAMGSTGLSGLDMSQVIKQKDITIELTEEQFKQIAFQGVDQSTRDRINVKILEGKIVIIVRLF